MKTFIYSIFFLLLFSCATEMPPTGGPKDEEPPQFSATKSHPDSVHLTNFSGNRISLSFSEKIGVHNFTQNFSSNPQLATPPKYRIKKDKLELIFKDSLLPNTTYILSLNNCIEDITEKNRINQFTFAFATGPYMDSLSLKGRLKDEYNNSNASGFMISLFPTSDTLDVFTHQPTYTTSSLDNGTFELNYLKPGNYTLFAYEKPKFGTTPSLPTKIGFAHIQLDSSATLSNNIKIFQQYPDSINIKYLKQKKQYILLKTISPITVLNNNLLSTYLDTEQAYHLFPTTFPTDTFLTISVQDLYGNRIDSVITYKPIQDTLINNIKITGQQTDQDVSFIINSNTPISYSTSTLSYIKNANDTLTHHYTRQGTFLTDTISFRAQKFITYQTLFDSSSFYSIYNIDNQIVNKNLAAAIEENVGIISGKIKSDNIDFIFHLLNSNNQIVRTLINQNDILFTNLSPDIYTYRIILDQDQNKAFSDGNFHLQKQPEHVIHSSQSITLKANWEIDNILIDLNELTEK